MAFNQAVGNDTLTVPYLAEDARPSDAEGWQALGEELGDIAAELDAEGLRLAYHNHDFEMEVYDDKTALEHLLMQPDLTCWQNWISPGSRGVGLTRQST